ncbi:hypothetical protein BCR35DRAFT_336619 [Leucosporidium creatinivorum]|uniref:Mitochondrial carrier domain-containing protein n=1 Tax=Leucosporidium creatinivorum TaxID=106004 RepID=A0A1Y2BNE5_9BASI|nr:hypothetical protein BCR35DRAFT_336619 [Leucosporidium creatinivorum]
MASTLPPLAQATSGALASVVSNLLVYPLDTVTTRMQTSKGRSTLVSSFKRMSPTQWLPPPKDSRGCSSYCRKVGRQGVPTSPLCT